MTVRVNPRAVVVLFLLVPIVGVVFPWMAGTAYAHTDAYVSHDLTCPTGDPGAGSPPAARNCSVGETVNGTTWRVTSDFRTDGDTYRTFVEGGTPSAGTLLCVAADDHGTAGQQKKWWWKTSAGTSYQQYYDGNTGSPGGGKYLSEHRDAAWYENRQTTDYFFYRPDPYASNDYSGTAVNGRFSACSTTDPGTPALARTGAVPQLECSRVMRTAGGLWWVDLSAEILNAAAGDTYLWDVSWDANTYGSGTGLPGESRVTLQLPTDLSTLPAKGWSATFKVTRTYGTGIAADTASFDDVGGGDFLESDEPEAGSDDLFWGGSDWLELLSDLFLGTDYDPTSDLMGEYLDDFRSGYEFKRQDGTYADSEADFSEVGGGDFTTVEAFCTVPVDPRRPESTPPIRTQPPTEDPPTADATGGECFQAESTDVSWDPRTWLRAAWNSALNVLQFVRSASCILKWAFIPPDGLPFSDLWCTRDGFGDPVSGLCAEFPFNALTEVTGSFDAFHDRLELAQANSPCATLDLRDVPPPIPGRPADDLDFLNIKLPTPSSASCDGYAVSASAVAAEDQAGDLFGYREEFRLLLLVALWVAFAYKALRAFAPDGEKAEEIAP